jgi:hypothetical protein
MEADVQGNNQWAAQFFFGPVGGFWRSVIVTRRQKPGAGERCAEVLAVYVKAAFVTPTTPR